MKKNDDQFSSYSNGNWYVYPNKGNSHSIGISFGKTNRKMLLMGGGIGYGSFSIRNSGNQIQQIVGDGFSILPSFFVQQYISLLKSKLYYSPLLQTGFYISRYKLDDLDGSGTNSFETSGSSNGFFTKLKPLAFSFILKERIIISSSVGEYNLKVASIKNEVSNFPYSSFKLYKKENITSAGLNLRSFSVGISVIMGN